MYSRTHVFFYSYTILLKLVTESIKIAFAQINTKVENEIFALEKREGKKLFTILIELQIRNVNKILTKL